MNIQEITQLAELMTAHDLSEIKLETENSRLRIRRGRIVETTASVVQSGAAAAVLPSPAAVETREALVAITSPIVGTFYAAPSPDAPPFVKPGDRVNPDSVVCIVEAMKVMNEIKAETSGVIKRAMVENATPVEFGQPLFEIIPG